MNDDRARFVLYILIISPVVQPFSIKKLAEYQVVFGYPHFILPHTSTIRVTLQNIQATLHLHSTMVFLRGSSLGHFYYLNMKKFAFAHSTGCQVALNNRLRCFLCVWKTRSIFQFNTKALHFGQYSRLKSTLQVTVTDFARSDGYMSTIVLNSLYFFPCHKMQILISVSEKDVLAKSNKIFNLALNMR